MIFIKQRFISILLGSTLVIILGIYIARLLFVLENQFMIDDAFIHLRFAENFAQGYGFAWNRGEAPVEGFTSILYLFLLVAVKKAGSSLISFMPIFGVACSLLVLVLSWQLGEFLNPGHRLENLLALILIGSSPILLFWSTTGMEMSFYTVLLMISAMSYLRYRREKIPAWLVGCLFGITTLIRPEGLVLFGVTFLFDGLTGSNGKKRLISRDSLVMILAFMFVYLPVFISRWSYFGYPFPNTYYAKTGPINFVQVTGGLKYLAASLKYILAGVSVPVFLILIRFYKIRWDGKFPADRLYVILLILCSWVITVINGGDHFAYGRFLLPTIPFLFVILITVGYSNFLESRTRANSINAALLVLPILSALYFWQPWSLISPRDIDTSLPTTNSKEFGYYQFWDAGFINMGKTLSTITSENESIAVVPIGAIGYFSGIRVIDMAGLVDPVIAHQPFDPAYTASWRPGHDKGDGLYVLSKHPDYIQLIDVLTSQPHPGLDDHAQQYKSIVEIWASPEFHANYVFHPIKTEAGWYYNLYRRIDSIIE